MKYFHESIIYTHTHRNEICISDYYIFIISTWCERKYRKLFENLYLPFFHIKKKRKNIEIGKS